MRRNEKYLGYRNEKKLQTVESEKYITNTYLFILITKKNVTWFCHHIIYMLI